MRGEKAAHRLDPVWIDVEELNQTVEGQGKSHQRLDDPKEPANIARQSSTTFTRL